MDIAGAPSPELAAALASTLRAHHALPARRCSHREGSTRQERWLSPASSCDNSARAHAHKWHQCAILCVCGGTHAPCSEPRLLERSLLAGSPPGGAPSKRAARALHSHGVVMGSSSSFRTHTQSATAGNRQRQGADDAQCAADGHTVGGYRRRPAAANQATPDARQAEAIRAPALHHKREAPAGLPRGNRRRLACAFFTTACRSGREGMAAACRHDDISGH